MGDITFKAKIKVGAGIFHDHWWGKWPACRAPNGRDVAENPDMDFTVTYNGNSFWCKAPGYGDLDGKYGNGSIAVSKLEDLICENASRKKVLATVRSDLTAKRATAQAALDLIDNAIAAIT